MNYGIQKYTLGIFMHYLHQESFMIRNHLWFFFKNDLHTITDHERFF